MSDARAGRPPVHVRPEPRFVRWLTWDETAAAVILRGWGPDALREHDLAWFTSPDWRATPDGVTAVCSHPDCVAADGARPAPAQQVVGTSHRRAYGADKATRFRNYCDVHMAGHRVISDGAQLVVVHAKAVRKEYLR
jgi:hypothetical protein